MMHSNGDIYCLKELKQVRLKKLKYKLCIQNVGRGCFTQNKLSIPPPLLNLATLCSEIFCNYISPEFHAFTIFQFYSFTPLCKGLMHAVANQQRIILNPPTIKATSIAAL